jgi:hypothetical protein
MPTPGNSNLVNGPYLPIWDVVIASPRSEDHTDVEPTQSIVPSHDLNTSNDDELRFGVLISPSSVRFGCFAVRFGDKESSNLTLRHRVSGAKERSYRRDRHQGVCTYAALRLRPQTKSENGRHLRTAQSGPTNQVPGITYTTCSPCGRHRNLPLYMYLYLHM